MKLYFLCACLFLSFCGCTPSYAQEKSEIERIKEEVDSCNFEEVQDISKKIALKIQNLEFKKSFYDLSRIMIQCRLDPIYQMKEEIDRKYQYYYHTNAIDLLSYQAIYPFMINDLYQDFVDMYQEDKKIERFSTMISLKRKNDSRLEQLQTKLDLTEAKINQNSRQVRDLAKLQQKLFYRFSFELSSFDEKIGKHDPHKIIQGSKDLPGYGSIYNYDQEKLHSCLEYGYYAIDSYSLFWQPIVDNGTLSAGTWNYPNGDVHLGLDIASNMYTEIKAPANGIILYADACVDSNNGYLSNWCGWPAGGGNTICMIVGVNEKLYGVTLAHLSDEIFVVPGQQVFQGDVIAHSGNSGNSSGPHTHIEVFEINTSLEEVVNYFITNADFSFGNGFDEPATCSNFACRIRPESVF